jgi:beta-N-acetylhexosaminidase
MIIVQKALSLLVAVAVATAPASAFAKKASSSNAKSRQKTSTLKSKLKPFDPNEPALSEDDEKLIAEMPLKTKVGQILFLGFTGTTVKDTLKKVIPALKPGAIVMFGRNIKSAPQVAELNRAAQEESIKASGLPLLIGVDQEGGNVIRIKTTYPLPSALAFGKSEDTDLVERAGSSTGRLLKVLGFNMNLAPVLDVADPKTGKFLGTRSYGNDPKLVAKMGAAFSRGLQTAEIMPTSKHFPGHGGVDGDSHLKMPSKDSSIADLEKKDLIPFESLEKSSKRPWAVMLAHITFPEIDPSGAPASFSKPIVTDLLRKKLGFDGVVITDDIQMAGAGLIPDIKERSIRAVEAGVDMIMITWNKKMQASVAKAIEGAVTSGRISEERINESLRRIISAKRAYSMSPENKATEEELRLALKSEEFKKLAEETLMSAFKKAPTREETSFSEYQTDRPVMVFSANQKFTLTFKDSVEEANPQREVRSFALGSGQSFNIDRVMRSNPDAAGVFYASGPQIAKLAGKISDDVAQRILLVTAEAPSALPNAETFKVVAETYYRHPELGKFIAERYFGDGTQLRGPASTRVKNKVTSKKKLQKKASRPEA